MNKRTTYSQIHNAKKKMESSYRVDSDIRHFQETLKSLETELRNTNRFQQKRLSLGNPLINKNNNEKKSMMAPQCLTPEKVVEKPSKKNNRQSIVLTSAVSPTNTSLRMPEEYSIFEKRRKTIGASPDSN